MHSVIPHFPARVRSFLMTAFIALCASSIATPAFATAPVITGTPATSVNVGSVYSFQPNGYDPDDEPVTFVISNKPSWATFSKSTGLLRGTPTTAGTWSNIRIGVNDSWRTTYLPTFSITAKSSTSTNSAPKISGTPATSATVGQAYSFRPTASDANGDALTFFISNKPSWASFSSATGTLSGTPSSSNVGTTSNIVIKVSDGKTSASLSAFSITVATSGTSSNRAPVISGTAPSTATVGVGYSFKPSASDPDGNSLSFSISNKPSWATFSTSSGQLSGTPSSSNVGTTSGIVIGVSDGKATTSLGAFSITVSSGGSSSDTANLYVSPSGNDSGNCTSSAPCRTIDRAASLSAAGNVISVAAGSYGGFTISRSGTSSAPITYKASGTVTVSNSGGYGIYINNASYVVVDGFTVTNTGSKGIAARGATPTSPMRGLVIKNNSISNTQEEGMYLSEVASSLIENNVITDVGRGGVETTGHGIYLANAGSKNTTIRGNTLQSNGNTWGMAIHMNGDVSVGGDGLITGLVIENNSILGGFNNGLSMDGVQNSDIRNNIIVNTSHHGIRAFQIDGAAGPKGLRIVNNTINAPKGNAVKTTEDAGSSVVFNNILVGRDGATSFESSSSTSNNVTTWAVNSDYSPTSAAIGKGVTSYAGVTAPSTDMDGRTRQTPYDVGALAH